MTKRHIYVAGIVVAVLHLLGFCLTYWYVSTNASGQAPVIFIVWAFIDLPWSLPLYELLNWNLWLIHGLIGTAWWFVLTILITRIGLGIKLKVTGKTQTKKVDATH